MQGFDDRWEMSTLLKDITNLRESLKAEQHCISYICRIPTRQPCIDTYNSYISSIFYFFKTNFTLITDIVIDRVTENNVQSIYLLWTSRSYAVQPRKADSLFFQWLLSSPMKDAVSQYTLFNFDIVSPARQNVLIRLRLSVGLKSVFLWIFLEHRNSTWTMPTQSQTVLMWNMYEIIHIWNAVIDESEEWSSH